MRFAPRHSLERLIWFGLALQVLGAVLNLAWGIAGLNLLPSWLFGTQMLVMFANAFVMSNSAAGAISIRPEAAGTASGAMGFLQMGIGSLFSQFGAFLGGHFASPVALNDPSALGVIVFVAAPSTATVTTLAPDTVPEIASGVADDPAVAVLTAGGGVAATDFAAAAVTVKLFGENAAFCGLRMPTCAVVASAGTVTSTTPSFRTVTVPSWPLPIQARSRPVKPEPVTVITVPAGPEAGEKLAMIGCG